MAIYVSSNHFSHEDQVKDAVNYLEREYPAEYAQFLGTFDDYGVWVEFPENMDAEYGCWVTDWIESHTAVQWNDGEPLVWEPSDYVAEYDPERKCWVLRLGEHEVDTSNRLTDLLFENPGMSINDRS